MKLLHILFLGIVFVFFLHVSDARAETTWLVIPSQYWQDEHAVSGDSWMPTQIIPFRDFGKWKGQDQCAVAARSIHRDPLLSPNFSFCTTVLPEMRIWH